MKHTHLLYGCFLQGTNHTNDLLSVVGTGCDRAVWGVQCPVETWGIQLKLLCAAAVWPCKCKSALEQEQTRLLTEANVSISITLWSCSVLPMGRKIVWFYYSNYGQGHLFHFLFLGGRKPFHLNHSRRASTPGLLALDSVSFSVFLVGSQCCVAGEHFIPAGCTYKPLLSSSTKACQFCASSRSEAGAWAVPSRHPVSLLGTCKGLTEEGRRQAHPCDSPQIGGECAAAVCNLLQIQVGFECKAPSWLSYVMLGHLHRKIKALLFCGEERLILLNSLTGGNPEWNYCVTWTIFEDGDETPRFLLSMFCW